MKYPQHILASHTHTLRQSLAELSTFPGDVVTGPIAADRQTMLKVLGGNLHIARRQELEENEEFRQWLPYYVFTRKGQHGLEVFTYQRSKKQGENRLLGKYSIGLGGHMDIVDVRHHASVVDVAMTLAISGQRELHEEIGVVVDNKSRTGFSYLTGNYTSPVFTSFLLDDTDAVGRVHVGLVHVFELPEKVDLFCVGDGNVTEGFLPLGKLPELDLENWSRMLVGNSHLLLA